MDCSVLYATEYPILWVKLPSHCSVERESYDFRAQEVDSCTPVPLSQGSALIVRDNRFRYNKWLWLPNRVFLPYPDRWYFATCIWNLGKNVSSMTNFSEKLNNLFRKLVPTSSEKLTWKIFREINLHSNSMEQLVSRKYKKVFFIFSTLWFRWGRFHLLSLYAHSTRYNALLSPVPLLLGRNPITMSFFTC